MASGSEARHPGVPVALPARQQAPQADQGSEMSREVLGSHERASVVGPVSLPAAEEDGIPDGGRLEPARGPRPPYWGAVERFRYVVKW